MIAGNIERIRRLHVRRIDTGEILATVGREAWCLAQLIVTGTQGVTPLERPAPRWSDYVFRLRKRGLPNNVIEAITAQVFSYMAAKKKGLPLPPPVQTDPTLYEQPRKVVKEIK